MKKLIFLFILTIFITSNNFAQRGKDGAKVITGTEIVNAFTMLTIDVNAGDTLINVLNSNLNSNFSSNLSAGDLIMIYQVQGVSIEDSISSIFGNSSKFFSTWGRITNYNNAGNYEFLQVKNVPNATSIIVDCPLQKNYTFSGRVLVIRVPRYATLTINTGGTLTTSQWNGSSGGVIATEVLGLTTINTGGKIDASGLGFRGGASFNALSVTGGLRYADANPNEGAQKGEGIAGDPTIYATFNDGGAKQCRGAAANAGGGGNAHNAGGGGGSNSGSLGNWNNGVGNPDISSANYITAWNVETAQSGLSSATISSGGGRGGYSFFSSDRNELTVPPGNATWGGDNRANVGGLGGRPLDYSLGKIFIGGGGGSGEGNNNEAGKGGNGGGLIFLKTYDAILGAGNILSNGTDGTNVIGVSPPIGGVRGTDGGGGAGAGGSIVLQTTTIVSLTGNINANGGIGGNQQIAIGLFGSAEGEGPGGGGGGGYVAISAGSPIITTNGGTNGTTNCAFVSNFPPNGATKGGVGISNGTMSSFNIIANDKIICPNNTAILSATYSGTPPLGAIIEWYDAEFGGNLLQSGGSFTTPLLSSQTTYFVKSCPGTFTIPVTVFMNACSVAPIADLSSTDSTICPGSCLNFTDLSLNTPSSWKWYFFGSDSLTSNLQNPTNICYSNSGTFDVALVVSNPSGSDSLYYPNFITVFTPPNVVASSNDSSLCLGETLILTGGGASNYTWTNGAVNNIGFTPVISNLYTVTGTDVLTTCQNTDTLSVFVNDLPSVLAHASDTVVCLGDSLTLFGSGAFSYVWDLGVLDSVKFAPTTTNTYNVLGTDINGCSNSNQINVVVGICGVAPISIFSSIDSTICVGSCLSFTDLSSNLPTSWYWYFFGSDSLNSSVKNPTNICYNTPGNFAVALVSSNSSGTDSLFLDSFITVFDLPVITTSPDTSVCSGSSVNLWASGANTYNWDNGLGAGPIQTPSPLINTTYSVIGTDLNNCFNSGIINVSILTLPIIITSPDTTVCMGDTVKLRANGALNYSWDNGLGTGQYQNTNPLVSTTFTVTGSDINNCSSSSQIDVTILGLPTVTPSANSTICLGDTIVISASGTLLYSWDNGLGFGQSKPVFPSVTTLYTVIGADGNGCRDTANVTISVNSCLKPIANFTTSDTSICINHCIDFTDLTTNDPTNWKWYLIGSNTVISTNSNPSNICYNTIGAYDVALVVTNVYGSDSLFKAGYIKVDSCLTPSTTKPNFLIANIFTPNVDGHNDLFKVTGVGIKNVKMTIFNRWGQLVFQSLQLNEGWDGRNNSGIMVPAGTYFYVVEVETDIKEIINGTLTLIR